MALIIKPPAMLDDFPLMSHSRTKLEMIVDGTSPVKVGSCYMASMAQAKPQCLSCYLDGSRLLGQPMY